MAILPRYQRMRQRDWKDPFSWFDWYKKVKGGDPFFTYTGGTDPRAFRNGTFTRADASTCATLQDSSTAVATVAANIPRYMHYDPSNPSLGPLLWLEATRINSLTYGRDLTNAAWTATTCTVAATTGADGVANSGSRLTATAGNATVIRAAALVHGSQARSGYLFVKRVTGTGNIDVTLDNGGAWTTISVTSAYTRLGKVQTLANSQFGIRLVTNGDVIDVDYCQNEAGAFPSSVIPTVASAVTRAVDASTFPIGFSPQPLTLYAKTVEYAPLASAVSERILEIGNGAGARLILYRDPTGGGSVAGLFNNGSTSITTSAVAGSSVTAGTVVEWRLTVNLDGSMTVGVSVNGGAEVTGTSATQSLPASWGANTLNVNRDGTGSGNGYAGYQSVKVAPGAQSRDAMRLG